MMHSAPSTSSLEPCILTIIFTSCQYRNHNTAQYRYLYELYMVDIYKCKCLLTGDDFAIIQQEIVMMKDCKHPNIVAYFGSYLRYIPSTDGT